MGRHPGAIQDVFVLSVSAAVSQYVLYFPNPNTVYSPCVTIYGVHYS